MITDLKNFTLKKLKNSRFFIISAGVFGLFATGFALAQNQSHTMTVCVLILQGGLLFLLSKSVRMNGVLAEQIQQTTALAKEAEVELIRLKGECAAKSLFIETAGAELLESSRAVFDAARFLDSTRLLPQKRFSLAGVEGNLLENAEHIYTVSHDFVVLAQLQKGTVCLLEQEIDPVELVTWCAGEVWKKSERQKVIKLEQTPDLSTLIKGDLSKLKQMLAKLLKFAVACLQVDGADVKVGIFIDDNGCLTISLKLGGRHLKSKEFNCLCFPLDNFSHKNEGINFDMAIAKQLANLHQGDIVIHKQTSSGTVLAFILPPERLVKIPLSDRLSATCTPMHADKLH